MDDQLDGLSASRCRVYLLYFVYCMVTNKYDLIGWLAGWLNDWLIDWLNDDADLQQAFESVDYDGDGVINAEQLEQIAHSLNLSLSRAQAESVISRFGSKGES